MLVRQVVVTFTNLFIAAGMADRLKIVVEKRDGIVPLLPSSPDEIWILCFNVTRCTRTVQFLVCTGGVFIFYLLYGYMQV